MKLTTAYRDKQTGVLTGTKDHYLACHVQFNNEERAIIQERGLYDHFVTVPSDAPPSTRKGDFGAMVMRIAGIIIAPLGLLFACVAAMNPRAANGAGPWGWLLLIGGVALFTVGKFKDIQANRREANPEQKLTLRRLLTNPDFVVHAYSVDEARQSEQIVRAALTILAERIRENAAVPEQQSYEL